MERSQNPLILPELFKLLKITGQSRWRNQNPLILAKPFKLPKIRSHFFLYQRLVKSRSFNLSDTDPEPLLTVQIPGCALRPINIPVITTTASTLIKISRFSVKHRYIPSYRIYTRPLSFLSSQGGICYCYFITTASEYYYEGNRIYNVKFAIGIALMITRPRSDSAVSVSSRRNLNWKEATISKIYGRKAKHYKFDKDGNQ